MEGEPCDSEIPPQVLCSRKPLDMHTLQEARSGAVGNSINSETTQISNSGRDKLWYFHVMDPSKMNHSYMY